MRATRNDDFRWSIFLKLRNTFRKWKTSNYQTTLPHIYYTILSLISERHLIPTLRLLQKSIHSFKPGPRFPQGQHDKISAQMTTVLIVIRLVFRGVQRAGEGFVYGVVGLWVYGPRVVDDEVVRTLGCLESLRIEGQAVSVLLHRQVWVPWVPLVPGNLGKMYLNVSFCKKKSKKSKHKRERFARKQQKNILVESCQR